MENFETYPMLLSLLRNRYSCRDYNPERMPGRDLVDAVLDAARIAPSACNRQPWMFITVDDSDGRATVIESYDRPWIRTAPMFIIALGNHDEAWHRKFDGKDHTDVDVAIAVEHICLAATAVGLATCWVCNFDPEIIRRGFGLPDHLEPVAIIPLGYAAAGCEAPRKIRKDMSEIVRHNAADA